MSYVITRAIDEYLSFLPDIERQAAFLFKGHELPEHVLEETTAIEDFRAAMQAGYLWVALEPAGQPVGFAHAEPLGELLHLEELDVTPAHGRRGLGRLLVEAVCACARDEGRVAVTLTTFKDLAWNAPFYQRLGFHVIRDEEWPPSLRSIVEDETRRGLPPSRRVVMRRWVQP